MILEILINKNVFFFKNISYDESTKLIRTVLTNSSKINISGIDYNEMKIFLSKCMEPSHIILMDKILNSLNQIYNSLDLIFIGKSLFILPGNLNSFIYKLGNIIINNKKIKDSLIIEQLNKIKLKIMKYLFENIDLESQNKDCFHVEKLLKMTMLLFNHFDYFHKETVFTNSNLTFTIYDFIFDNSL